jgi:hypothetical protein
MEMTDNREINMTVTGTVSYPDTPTLETPEQAEAWIETEMQKELEKLLLITGPVYYTDRWRGVLIDRINKDLENYFGKPKIEIEFLVKLSKDK